MEGGCRGRRVRFVGGVSVVGPGAAGGNRVVRSRLCLEVLRSEVWAEFLWAEGLDVCRAIVGGELLVKNVEGFGREDNGVIYSVGCV